MLTFGSTHRATIKNNQQRFSMPTQSTQTNRAKSFWIRLALSVSLFFATGLGYAQLGSAPMRIGEDYPTHLDLKDQSMVWMAVSFENISKPSFALRDLIVWFENTKDPAQKDFFSFKPLYPNELGRTQYLIGLALPVGEHRITSITGTTGITQFLIVGKMWFKVNIPLNVPKAGQHYYLGNITIKNIEVKANNKQTQRSGEPFPLIDQLMSGFGNGTLAFGFEDQMYSDVALIKKKFSAVVGLQNVVFEKNIIPEIRVPYAFGQNLDPIIVKLKGPSKITGGEVSGSNDAQLPVEMVEPIKIPHNHTVPPVSSFASNLDIQHLPQKMNEPAERFYSLYRDSKLTKALAISGYGSLGLGFGADAMKLAINNCEKHGKPCALYAVDDMVVWNPDLPMARDAKLNQEKILAVESKLRPTGFASLEDFEAVPKLGPKGKQLYIEWLSKPNPKAVAISDRGALARGYGKNAISTALETCEKFGRPCRIYGLNDEVVFDPFIAVTEKPILESNN